MLAAAAPEEGKQPERESNSKLLFPYFLSHSGNSYQRIYMLLSAQFPI